MLHPSGISTIEVGFKLIDVKIFPHCTEVEKGDGEEMIHLFGAIMNTCSLAGMNSNWHNLCITDHLSR